MRTIIGISKAQVVSTKEFNKEGKIQIRLLGSADDNAPELCEVLTPFGGLPNMGMIAVPPVGAIGFVAFGNLSDASPVWIGSLLQDHRVADQEKHTIAVESQDPSDFIIKTQYTREEEEGGEVLDGVENKVENILKMNNEEFTLAKVIQDDDNYEYKTEAYNIEDANYNIIKMTDDEIKIKFKVSGTDDYSEIKLNKDGIYITHIYDDENINKIHIQSDGIALSNNNDGKNSNIDIKFGKVLINTSEKIILGGDDDDAVKFSALRDFINQSYNSHVHGTPAGPSTPPTTPFTNTNRMKSSKVRLS